MTARSALARAAGAGLTAAAVTLVVGRLAPRRPPGGAERWSRTNHAGATVTLLEGPAVVLGGVAGALVGRPRTGAWVTAVVGCFGALDDHRGDASSKGLGGHLAALRRGRVTTGTVKLAGLVATGAAAALAVRRSTDGLALLVVDAGVVAGSANLVNLLDLRPGRALKAVGLLAAPLALAGSVPAAAALGAAAAALPDDLAGRSMLGDTGANALGALVGTAAVATLPSAARVAILTGLTGLTLASERVSFTSVIAATPVLRELDAWGRPTAPAAAS